MHTPAEPTASRIPPQPVWAIMPVLANPDYTRTAIATVLAQSIPTRILIINQGVVDAFRTELEAIAEEYPDRVLLWSHQPPLPSLAATWNRALQFVWETGGTEALVVNNDVELHPETVEQLVKVLRLTDALFVSAVGVTAEQFDPTTTADPVGYAGPRGGPDFSCFLIARECHQRFQFDEHFIPAFCEDLDYHRQLLLAGEGARIFSVNLPYLHYGSATIKSLEAPARMKLDRAIDRGSRAYYQKKWGGPVNGETFLKPFGGGFSEPAKVEDGTATTPYLQERARALASNPPIDDLARKLLGIPNDGLALTSGPDDGYRGQHRHNFSYYDQATATFLCPCGERLPQTTSDAERR